MNNPKMRGDLWNPALVIFTDIDNDSKNSDGKQLSAEWENTEI